MRKWKDPPHSVNHFYIHYYPQKQRIVHSILSYSVKTIDIDNKYDLY